MCEWWPGLVTHMRSERGAGITFSRSHVQVQRAGVRARAGEDIVFLATDINLPGAVDWVMMQSCFGQHFMLVLEKQERQANNAANAAPNATPNADSQLFYAVVQLIGTRKQADSFIYRLGLPFFLCPAHWTACLPLILNSKVYLYSAPRFDVYLELNGNRRRLTWEAVPRSIHEGVQAAIATSDCLVFDHNIAQVSYKTLFHILRGFITVSAQ